MLSCNRTEDDARQCREEVVAGHGVATDADQVGPVVEQVLQAGDGVSDMPYPTPEVKLAQPVSIRARNS